MNKNTDETLYTIRYGIGTEVVPNEFEEIEGVDYKVPKLKTIYPENTEFHLTYGKMRVQGGYKAVCGEFMEWGVEYSFYRMNYYDQAEKPLCRGCLRKMGKDFLKKYFQESLKSYKDAL